VLSSEVVEIFAVELLLEGNHDWRYSRVGD
jgi:hypothetical protein